MIALGVRGLESVFGWLIEASWQAAVLALMVLTVQWAFRSRLNPRWNYLLWLLVVVRLVLPALPESVLSLFQFAPHAPTQISVTVSQPLFAPRIVAGEELTAATAAHAGLHVTFYTLLAFAWLAGAMGLLAVTWWTNRRFARQMGRRVLVDAELGAMLDRAKAELGVTREVRLVECERVESPAIMGLFQPTLLLPRDAKGRFSAEELRLIFLHELAHLKRGDVAVQWLIAGLQILHWFNPVLWLAFRRMRIDREPATDALVLSRTGEEQKEHYGEMLIKQLEHFNQRHSIPTLVGILEDKDQFKRRFAQIARFTRGAYGWSLLGAVLVIALALTCLTKGRPVVSGIVGGTELRTPPAHLEVSLPSNPTKQQVREYIGAVLKDMPEFATNSSLKDVQIVQLKKVGAENIDLLIEENARHMMFGIANPTTNYYLSMAICDLARPQDKEIVLKALPKNRYLVYTVLRMGWSLDAREELLRVFRQEPGRFSPGWIEAIASMNDSSTYGELKAYLVHGKHREHTYNALKKIPDIGDLKPSVEEAWKLAKSDGGYEARDMARIAAQYGIEEAIDYLIRAGEKPPSRLKEVALEKIKVAVMFFSVDRESMRKLVSVPDSDEYVDHPLKGVFESSLSGEPGVMQISGMFGEKTTQELLKALGKTPGVEISTTPTVWVKSGAKARVDSTHPMRYPTSFEPKPNDPGVLVPGDFETRNVGLLLEVAPTIGADAKTVELQAFVEFCELLGYQRIKDGSYMKVEEPGGVKESDGAVQPLFNTRRIETKLFIRSGYSTLIRLSGGELSKEEKALGKAGRFAFMLLTATVESGQK